MNACGVAVISTREAGDRPFGADRPLQESAPAELGVELGGNLVPLGAPEQGAGELIGILAAFAVLLLTFGSLRAAGANLLVAGFGVGVGVLGVFAYGSFTPIGANAIILAAMLGLTVGIDYGLFVVSRFQQELRRGRTKPHRPSADSCASGLRSSSSARPVTCRRRSSSGQYSGGAAGAAHQR